MEWILLIQVVAAAVSAVAATVSARAALRTMQVGKDTAEANRRQIEIAEKTRLSQIRPHVVIYTRAATGLKDVVELFVHNVGAGAARNVKVTAIKGGDIGMRADYPVTKWRPLSHGINILVPNESMATLLFSHNAPGAKEFAKTAEIIMEVSYSDVEGNAYPPERFILDLYPIDGRTWVDATTDTEKALGKIAAGVEALAKQGKR